MPWFSAFLRRGVVVAAFVVGCDRASEVAPGESVVRQPIPEGIDPRMVEYRSDGVLIPSRDSLMKVPGYVVDSVFSPEENLRRFRATVSGPAPTRLRGGASSVDELLRRYWGLLATGDTLAITPLVVSRAEYAYLYVPSSPEFAAGMPPHVGWELILSQSGRGLTRALAAARREPAPVVGTACSLEPRTVGSGALHGPCGVVLRRAAGIDTVWVAQSVFAHGGVFKLLGLQNELRGQ